MSDTLLVRFFVVVALLAFTVHQVAAGNGTVLRMFITDKQDVQVDVRQVKIYSQFKKFGSPKPQRKQLKALPGARGMGKLAIDLEAIQQIKVKESGFTEVLLDLQLRDGQQLDFAVFLGRGDIIFEGKTPVGTYSISLKNMKEGVLEFEP